MVLVFLISGSSQGVLVNPQSIYCCMIRVISYDRYQIPVDIKYPVWIRTRSNRATAVRLTIKNCCSCCRVLLYILALCSLLYCGGRFTSVIRTSFKWFVMMRKNTSAAVQQYPGLVWWFITWHAWYEYVTSHKAVSWPGTATTILYNVCFFRSTRILGHFLRGYSLL